MARAHFVLALVAVFAGLSGGVDSGRGLASGDFATCARTVGYSGKLLTSSQRDELLARRSDPYADGKITSIELQWMRAYKDATGKDYVEGGLATIRALDDCMAGGGAIAPTRTPTVVTSTIAESAEADCQQWADTWEENYGTNRDQAAILSGCRLTTDGHWFLPTIPGDPRFPNGPILTGDEENRTASLRATIRQQIDGLQSVYPGWMWTETMRYFSPRKRPFYGYFDPSKSTSGFQDTYASILVPYLQNPDNWQIYAYALWIMQRKNAALPPAYCATEPPPICGSAHLALRLDWAPWPWDMYDEVTMGEFLKWVVDNGYA